MITSLSVGIIAVVLIIIVVINQVGGNGNATGGTPIQANVASVLLNPSPSVIQTVGTGNQSGQLTRLPGDTVLTGSDGKPLIVYVGAEYCPFCGAERWALAVALSRFGTFSGLRLIHSSSADVDPNTPTLSFYKATYTSKFVSFSPTEAQTVDRVPLQPVTRLDKSLMAKYDAPPYVPVGYNGSFPFVDFGSKYVITGASYDPGLLAGLSWGQVSADLADPTSPPGRAIDATANRITAAICAMTGNKPGDVCTSTGVTSASGSI